MDHSFNRLSKVHVAVLDNDDKIIVLMSSILKKLGFEKIYSAKDGFEGLSVLRNNKVDLIITDWELSPLNNNENNAESSSELLDNLEPEPPKNGACFVKFVRGSKKSQNPYIPIIMLTGHAVQHNIEYARDSGVDDIIVKPVSAQSLCSRIIRIVNSPRFFINTKTYKGPCRRRKNILVEGQEERRKVTAKVIKRRIL